NELDMLCADAGADRPMPRRREVTVRVVGDPAPLAAALADIHNRAYAGTPSFVRLSASEMAAMFPPDAVVLVAEQKEAVLGYCHLEVGPGESWIDTVVVDPRRQRQGIGATLMIEAMAEASRRGGPRIRLAVSDRNAAAYVLYRHLGFDVVAKSARYRADRETVLE